MFKTYVGNIHRLRLNTDVSLEFSRAMVELQVCMFFVQNRGKALRSKSFVAALLPVDVVHIRKLFAAPGCPFSKMTSLGVDSDSIFGKNRGKELRSKSFFATFLVV